MSVNFNLWQQTRGVSLVNEYHPPEGVQRRTKIIATIGPKTQTVEMLEKLMEAGVNVVRMNFSHGEHEFHRTTIVNARKAAENLRKVIGIMLDTKGPEIRTGKLVGGIDVRLTRGQTLTLTTNLDHYEKGDKDTLFVDYKNITKVLQPGNVVLIDDGLIGCYVQSVDDVAGTVTTTVQNSALLGERKGVNLPNVVVDLPALTDKDKEDLQFGVKMGVDFIAASFVRKREDVTAIRVALGSKGQGIKIISKIENAEGLENFDSILEESDAIMVARGDMGVEVPLEQVSLAQKMIIAKCNVSGKPVITATQMLESMIVNPRPTRAEAGDISNAVFDGTDAVMLSGETAKGIYPVEAVSRMAKICLTSESILDYRKAYNVIREAVLDMGLMSVTETIASSAAKTANDVGAKLICVLTETGNTARLVAKYRPAPPIYAITQNKETARQLMISRGVFAVTVGSVIGTERIIQKTISEMKDIKALATGDLVVVTSGHIEGISGSTNILKVVSA